MFERIKRELKARLPRTVLEAWWRGRRWATQWEFRRLGRREVFRRIYADNLWGGRPGEFVSGLGSTPEQADAYAEVVRAFMAAREIRSVVDLGCGDFRVAERFITADIAYTGVDIVPELIARNRRLFGTENVRFDSLDILEDPLPAADLCLIRQVLQHLSNDQISRVLTRLGAFRYVIVTEHVPAPAWLRAPNLDKPHGPDTRLPEGSGVFISEPPFSVAAVTLLGDVAADPAEPTRGGRLMSWVFTPHG